LKNTENQVNPHQSKPMTHILTASYAELLSYRKNPIQVMRAELTRCIRTLHQTQRRHRAFAAFLKEMQSFVYIDNFPRLNDKTEVSRDCVLEIRDALITETERLEATAQPQPQSGFKSVQLMIAALGTYSQIVFEELKQQVNAIRWTVNPNSARQSHNTYLDKWLSIAESWAFWAEIEARHFLRGKYILKANRLLSSVGIPNFFHPNKSDAERFPHIPGIPDIRFVRSRLIKPICNYSDLQGYHCPTNKVFWLDEVFPQCCNDGYSFLPDTDYTVKRFNF
jgi:hypothetical protein